MRADHSNTIVGPGVRIVLAAAVLIGGGACKKSANSTERTEWNRLIAASESARRLQDELATQFQGTGYTFLVFLDKGSVVTEIGRGRPLVIVKGVMKLELAKEVDRKLQMFLGAQRYDGMDIRYEFAIGTGGPSLWTIEKAEEIQDLIHANRVPVTDR